MANTRQCWICGKSYEYCSKCDRLNTWKLVGCTREHFQIANILDEFRGNVITAKEAKEKFKNIGITADSLDNLLPEVADAIKAIIDSVPVEQESVSLEKSELPVKRITNIKKTKK